MAYTPEFSQRESAIVRRIAWAMGVPMTLAQSEIIELVAKHLNQALVCPACKDNTFCGECPFEAKEITDEPGGLHHR